MPTKQELYSQMEQLLATAKAESRDLTSAERGRFDHLEAEFDLQVRQSSVPETRGAPGAGLQSDHDRAFTHYLRTGNAGGLPEYRADGAGLSTAPNSAGASAGTTGYDAGYLVPQGFWHNLQIALKAYSGIANDFKRVETPTGNPMPWPTVDPTGVTATLVSASSENTQLSLQNYYQFGQGMLNAWTVAAGPLLASLQVVQDSAFDVDQFIADRFGEAVGRQIAAQAVSGTGSGAPLGIITALAAKGAWSSGQSGGYINLTAATTVKTFAASAPTELAGNLLAPATLISMAQAIDPAYLPSARWYFNSTQAWNLRSTVDSNGRPLLDMIQGLDNDPNVKAVDYTAGSPVATLFGFPVVIDNNIPNLTASTVGGPVFGSMPHAMVQRVVSPGTRILRLAERWADYLAVGYLGFHRFDLRSNDLRAAVTVKPAAT